MRCTALALALPLLLAAGAARADDPPAPAGGPRLTVPSKVIEFPEVIQGAVLDLKLPVENTGDAPLLLTRAEPSCGCTVMLLPKEPIAPGAKVEVALRFDSTEKLGQQSLQLLLYSNDPTQNDMGRFCTQLFVQGGVRSVYRIAPAGAFFGEFVRGARAEERVITVTGQQEARRGFTARLTSQAPDHLEVTTEPVPGGEGGRPKGVKVKLRLLPHAPPGELSHLVELATDVPEQPRLRIPVVGIVIGRVVAPEGVSLLRVQRDLGTERRVPIERRDGQEGLRLVRTSASVPWLEVSAETVNGQRTDLVLRVPPGAPPGPFSGVVRVVLDEPDQPLLELPVFGHILPQVRVEPGLVRLRGDAPVTLEVRGGAVKRLAVEPAGAPLSAEVVEAKGAVTRVRVTRTGAVPPGARLVLETDVKGEERVAVDVEP